MNFTKHHSLRWLGVASTLALTIPFTVLALANDGSDFAETPAGDCGADTTLISAIQGSGAVSPMVGMPVVVEAVVVGDYQATKTSHPGRPELSGFYLQEEDADADGNAASSEGLFVHDPTKSLEITEGDLLRVAGAVSEFANNTQIDSITSILLCGTGLSVTPASLDLPVAAEFATLDDFYEPLEGMRVRFNNVMTVTGQSELARYGQLLLSADGPLRQYSQDASLPLNQPDYDAHRDAQSRSSIKLDDFNRQQNIDPVYFPQPGYFAVDNYIRLGAEINGLSGIINDTAGEWMVQAIKGKPPAIVNPERPASPLKLAGNARLAALNVHNYFNGDGQGSGFPTRRGADSSTELDRQTAKIVAAISSLNADVLGLMEIENDGANVDAGANDALTHLVNAVNAAVGAGTYAAVQAGANGGSDEIKVALMYKPAVLETVGTAKILATAAFTDPYHYGSQQSRPALAQTFRAIDATDADADTSAGAAFTAVVLHLKSKGSPCDGNGDDDVIQGNCNGSRTQGARALLDWLTSDPTDTLTHLGVVDPDVFIVGDFNAYFQEDPMQVFYQAGFVNLITQTAHTFVFDGRWGSLDHVLASPSLFHQNLVGNVWNINANESTLLDYNDSVLDASEADYEAKPATTGLYAEDAFGSSDHDPIWVDMKLLEVQQGDH